MKLSKFILGVCVFSLGIASAAPVYHVTFANPTWIGQTQVKAGDYELRVDGDKATFKQGKNVFEAHVKVETNSTKFSETQMEMKTINGEQKLQELDLQGTKSRLVMSDASASSAGTN